MSDATQAAQRKALTCSDAGAYVLATKWSDGDPRDGFAVGLLTHVYFPEHQCRYVVSFQQGQHLVVHCFRRCERISRRVGCAIVAAMPYISDCSGRSVWYWRRHIKELQNITGIKA